MLNFIIDIHAILRNQINMPSMNAMASMVLDPAFDMQTYLVGNNQRRACFTMENTSIMAQTESEEPPEFLDLMVRHCAHACRNKMCLTPFPLEPCNLGRRSTSSCCIAWLPIIPSPRGPDTQGGSSISGTGINNSTCPIAETSAI